MDLKFCYARAVELAALYRQHRNTLNILKPWRIIVEVDVGALGTRRYLVGAGAGAQGLNTQGYLYLPLGHKLQSLAALSPGDSEQFPQLLDNNQVTVLSRIVCEADASGELHTFDFHLPDAHIKVVRRDDGTFIESSLIGLHGRLATVLSDVLPYLTVPQFRLISRSSDSPTIIRGRAGSGKTSVGLYRLARAGHEAAVRNAASTAPGIEPAAPRLLVLTFNKALKTYVDLSTEEMGLGHVEALTLHAWARQVYSSAVGLDVSTPKSDSTPTGDAALLAELKTDPRVLKVLRAEVDRQAASFREKLPGMLAAYDPTGRWTQRYDATTGPVAARVSVVRREVEAARARASDAASAMLLENCHAQLTHAIGRLTRYDETLQNALMSPALLAEHVYEGDLELAGRVAAVAKALERQAGRVFMDDIVLCVHVVQYLHGGLVRAGSPEQVSYYDHAFVDEIQDVSLVDLLAVRGAVRSAGDITLAGDAGQQIQKSNHFGGWTNLCEHFGLSGAAAEPEVLDAPHRSTAPIMRLATAFLGEAAPVGERHGAKPSLIITGPNELWSRLARKIAVHLTDKPTAHVAVICRKRERVALDEEQLAAALTAVGYPDTLRTAARDTFRFEPGVTLTSAHQVKGLEFDAVYLLDLRSGGGYGEGHDDRRLLYTVATRARTQLTLVSVGEVHSFVRAALDAGLVEYDATDLAPPAEADNGLF
jgi:DNA helicase-2/ATP-dependent DNA helicase PcrA